MISAEEARRNCEECKKRLEKIYVQERKDYIKELEQRIIDRSKHGYYSINTANNIEKDFINLDFLNEIKIIFENKGFKVEKKSAALDHWLTICWE